MIKNPPQIKWCRSILNKWEKRCITLNRPKRISWRQNKSFWSKFKISRDWSIKGKNLAKKR
jgi:hypothetical protein